MSNQTGGCHCGAVRYELDAEPLFSLHCQCTDCQRIGGGGHASNFAVPEDAVSITGDLTEYTIKADSGSNITRTFCPSCGSPVCVKAEAVPGALLIRAGSLDDPSAFQPQMVIYTKSGHGWDGEVKNGMQTFEEMPPMG